MTSIPAVRKELLVCAAQDVAFRVFTDDMDTWWPRQHHIGKSPMKRIAIEPYVDGSWYSICEDHSVCRLGKVLAWEPPRRLLLAWQITSEWQYDESFLTEVELIFTARGPKQTHILFEHRNLDRFGLAAAELRKAIDAPEGWSLILQRFVEQAEA